MLYISYTLFEGRRSDDPRVLDRRNVFHFTWNDVLHVITDVLAEFYSMSNGGGLQSSLLAEIDYSGQLVTGWNETLTNVIPIAGLPDVVTESVVNLAYGGNNLPQTGTKTRQSGGTNIITYTWNDASFALESSEADSNLTDTYEKIYTHTDAGKIESRTDVFRGNIRDQTFYRYDADNRLESILYDLPIVTDTTIEVVWEEETCQPTMIWAVGAEPSFIATGNGPYLPATGCFQLNYCNL